MAIGEFDVVEFDVLLGSLGKVSWVGIHNNNIMHFTLTLLFQKLFFLFLSTLC